MNDRRKDRTNFPSSHLNSRFLSDWKGLKLFVDLWIGSCWRPFVYTFSPFSISFSLSPSLISQYLLLLSLPPLSHLSLSSPSSLSLPFFPLYCYYLLLSLSLSLAIFFPSLSLCPLSLSAPSLSHLSLSYLFLFALFFSIYLTIISLFFCPSHYLLPPLSFSPYLSQSSLPLFLQEIKHRPSKLKCIAFQNCLNPIFSN